MEYTAQKTLIGFTVLCHTNRIIDLAIEGTTNMNVVIKNEVLSYDETLSGDVYLYVEHRISTVLLASIAVSSMKNIHVC